MRFGEVRQVWGKREATKEGYWSSTSPGSLQDPGPGAPISLGAGNTIGGPRP